eukprot:1109948-Prymnesium_polylepis.1
MAGGTTTRACSSGTSPRKPFVGMDHFKHRLEIFLPEMQRTTPSLGARPWVCLPELLLRPSSSAPHRDELASCAASRSRRVAAAG